MENKPEKQGVNKRKEEKTAFQAIMNCKCPHCREGDVYRYPLTNVRKFDKMYSHCPACGQSYQIEPGFYFGATYVSYAFSMIIIVFFLALYLIFFIEYSELYLLAAVLVATLISVPFNFRYSRVLFLHLFGSVKYDPDAIIKYNAAINAGSVKNN